MTTTHGKIRITFGEKPNEEELNKHIINVNKLLKDNSIVSYVAGLEQSKKGIWHSQGILEINVSGATSTIANKSLLHKTKNGNKFNRSYTSYIKKILDISGSGNKTYSLTPITSDKVATYTDYCCKEGWRIVGNPELFEESRQRYNDNLREKKDNSNKLERDKRERRQKIKKLYIEYSHKSSTNAGLNISNLAKTQQKVPLGYDRKLFMTVLTEVYKESDATLYASSIHKHHQDILKICTDGAYDDYIKDMIMSTITQRTEYSLAMSYFYECIEKDKNKPSYFNRTR